MIFIICGPTASGKSAIALQLAEKYHGEIINGDAFQVYQELSIGTAKPTLEERKTIPHHLYDYISPSEAYSVQRYQKDARNKIKEILARKKIPIIVGGTGLYQKATIFDYVFEDQPEVDMSSYASYRNEEIYQIVKEIDPIAAQKIHPHNRKRLLRVLEIYHASGKKKSEQEALQQHQPIYEDCLWIGIDLARDVLYHRIDDRVDQMMEKGLLDEVKQLYHRYDPQTQALQAIGYKEWLPYFQNKVDLDFVIEQIKKHSRNYAKRQMTFFKNQLPVHWFHTLEDLLYYVDQVMKGEKRDGEN